jgi:type IV secretory pathway TrbD component
MREFLLFSGTFAVWLVLSRWVLPWFGVPTCISGICSMNQCPSCDPESRAGTEATSVETKGVQS